MPANASTSTLTRLARYAFDTAAHANPPDVVTAADVLNAFATPSLNPTLNAGALSLPANLGDLPELRATSWSRIPALFAGPA
jgi:hypothetical protein